MHHTPQSLHSHPHPQVHPRALSWSADQTLHVAVAYSNPKRWDRRRKLMEDFRRHMEASANVRLYVGELAYGDRPHEATEAGDGQDIQLRTSQELWHKENLLNRVIQHFPAGWKYGAIIDADFHFTRHDWALEAIHLLQHHEWVQLFHSYADVGPDHRPLNVIPSFAHQVLNRHTMPKSYRAGSPGGAWAFRRSAFAACGGLLDTCILGSADWYMAAGLAGMQDRRPESIRTPAGYRQAILAWQKRAHQLQRNIGVLDCFCIHHFHGSKRRRGYGDRWQILIDHAFDPCTDLFRDEQGIYQLTPDKPGLRDAIRRYFQSRSEDDLGLYGETSLA